MQPWRVGATLRVRTTGGFIERPRSEASPGGTVLSWTGESPAHLIMHEDCLLPSRETLWRREDLVGR